MDEQIKKCLNLTNIEYIIFDFILKRDKTPIGRLIKGLGLHKGTVYNSIRRLEEKGCVNYESINGIKIYSINKLSLIKLIDDMNDEHLKNKSIIQELIKTADSVKEDKKEETKIDILIGIKGFKTFFNFMLETAYKTKKEYMLIGKGNALLENINEEYYKVLQAKKRRLKIKSRFIFNEKTLYLPVMKHIFGNVRFLKMQNFSPAETFIYDNFVTIILWESKPVTIIMIKSKELENSFRNYFESLWKIAYTPNKIF